MPNLEAKKAIVAEIAEKMKNAQGAVVVDYRGLNVAEVTELRSKAREQGVEYKVYKNAMMRFAAQEAGLEGLLPSLVKFLGNPMFMHLKEVMEEAVVDSGNTLDTYDAANDAQKEANLFADLITNQYDAIFIAAVDYVASAPLIDQANEAGIPIAVVDSAVIGFENATFSVMSDNVKAGEIAMEALAKYMDYKGKMIIFENRMSYAVSQRSIGRDNVLRKYRDIEVVNTMNSPSSIDQAMFAMDNFLQADPDIAGAWGGNDLCAQGFVAAAKSAGKEAGDIGIVGIDGSEIGRAHV